MWAFLSARLRMWLIVAVVAPLVGWLLGKIGDLIEARRGPNGAEQGALHGPGLVARAFPRPTGGAPVGRPGQRAGPRRARPLSQLSQVGRSHPIE